MHFLPCVCTHLPTVGLGPATGRPTGRPASSPGAHGGHPGTSTAFKVHNSL